MRKDILQNDNIKQAEIIRLQRDYIALLIDELNDVVPIASMHGWKSNRFAQGEKIRNEISKLENKIGGIEI